jgi:hypothetical protein
MRVGARMSPKQRLAVRQTECAPLDSDLRNWFETARLPGRSPTRCTDATPPRGRIASGDRMRRLLIRSVLSVLALAILAVAWIVAGPWWARALDAIHTTRLATATSFSIRKYSGFFPVLSRPRRRAAPRN